MIRELPALAAALNRQSYEYLLDELPGIADALAVEGLDAALDRADDYLAAGADILFIEALPDVPAMQRALERFKGRAPVLANMVEGGKSPLLPAAELQRLGFSLAILPGGMVRAQTFAAQRYLEALKRDGTTAGMLADMLDFKALNELLGTEQWLERGKRYE